MAGVIRVAVADDQAVVRMGLRAMLEREPDMEWVGEAADGAAALALLRRARPDVLLLDIRMPGTDGVATLRAAAGDPELRGTKIVVVTTFAVDEYVFAALQAGASGFVLKDSAPDELVNAVRVVAAGEALLSPSITRKVIGLFARHGTEPVEGLDTLTPREREMVAWVATGRSNEEIAKELVISPDTVRTHVSRAMVKLHARDRAQLVVFAMRAGLAVPG
ncbi:response regulator transcription factor [Nonomuraea jiangxiensis]|uniref:DNA-binding response regulator, NarL/FixJ family, contains REC and HTH domains n=1 Tax=Nonomuraea jiangxiensis TaxID=633440 RepID=A0A1G8RM56_9ACTN|nr:response regulator transcription factor [Nonomuraea jiangxiensis]SDJ18164.1 DNA-binding response regulator, NarL/FixJ family, contains REC and HTH domains [Nonomuraea jiangxiensis]